MTTATIIALLAAWVGLWTGLYIGWRITRWYYRSHA